MTDQQQQQQQERYAFGEFEVKGCECPVESTYDEYIGNDTLNPHVHSTLIDIYDEYIWRKLKEQHGTVSNETAKEAWMYVIKTVNEYDDPAYREKAIEIARENGWDIDNDEIAQQ